MEGRDGRREHGCFRVGEVRCDSVIRPASAVGKGAISVRRVCEYRLRLARTRRSVLDRLRSGEQPRAAVVLMLTPEVACEARVVCRHMKERELEARVMRFVREIGIAPEGKVRKVGFDFMRGVVVINTDEATHAAPAAGLWSDYADNVARIRHRHAPLIKYPDGRTESGAYASVPHPD